MLLALHNLCSVDEDTWDNGDAPVSGRLVAAAQLSLQALSTIRGAN